MSCSFHYFPHRAVIRNDHSTTKLRIVFDASVHYTIELCLNDILEAGACLLPYLLDILLRFRTGKIADIKQAFFQIEMNENDCNLVRDSQRTSIYYRVSFYTSCVWVNMQSVLT